MPVTATGTMRRSAVTEERMVRGMRSRATVRARRR